MHQLLCSNDDERGNVARSSSRKILLDLEARVVALWRILGLLGPQFCLSDECRL